MSQTRRQPRPVDPSDAWSSADQYAAALNLSGRCSDAALALLCAVASNHRSGVPLAKDAGVTGDVFLDEDLAALWYALEASATEGRDKLGAAMLARRLLRRTGWWDPQRTMGFGSCMWSDENLARLFCSYPGTPPIPELARRLLATAARWRAVARLTTALDRLLLDDDSTNERPERAKDAA